LAAFLAEFDVHFTRAEAPRALERYLTGLLSEQPKKDLCALARVVPGTSNQSLQGLLTNMAWDEDDLNDQRVTKMLSLPSEGDACLIFDDTGFAKQGSSSVGTARQYSGTLGKVGNCQVSVNCHYAEHTLAWPVATRLYLPKEWTDDPQRLNKAKVPEGIDFQTKPQIALALLDKARALDVPHAAVVADCDYGDNPNFLAGLEKRKERYVVAVRADFQVATSRSGGLVRHASEVVQSQPLRAWRQIRWREGSKGWLRGQFVAVRCFRVLADGRRKLGWLIGEQTLGTPSERKYHWSNFGPRMSLERMVGYAHRRHWVEQFHEEAKGLLGWDQYRGRLWHGFHRNAVCVLLAYSFLVWLEFQHRQTVKRPGRKRRAFSPSARPQAHQPARGPSPHRRLAAA